MASVRCVWLLLLLLASTQAISASRRRGEGHVKKTSFLQSKMEEDPPAAAKVGPDDTMCVMCQYWVQAVALEFEKFNLGMSPQILLEKDATETTHHHHQPHHPDGEHDEQPEGTAAAARRLQQYLDAAGMMPEGNKDQSPTPEQLMDAAREMLPRTPPPPPQNAPPMMQEQPPQGGQMLTPGYQLQQQPMQSQLQQPMQSQSESQPLPQAPAGTTEGQQPTTPIAEGMLQTTQQQQQQQQQQTIPFDPRTAAAKARNALETAENGPVFPNPRGGAKNPIPAWGYSLSPGRARANSVLSSRPDNVRYMNQMPNPNPFREMARYQFQVTYQEVFNKFQDMCTLRAPPPFDGVCLNMMTAYRQIAEGIVYGDRPDQVCQTIEFCGAGSYVGTSPHGKYRGQLNSEVPMYDPGRLGTVGSNPDGSAARF